MIEEAERVLFVDLLPIGSRIVRDYVRHGGKQQIEGLLCEAGLSGTWMLVLDKPVDGHGGRPFVRVLPPRSDTSNQVRLCLQPGGHSTAVLARLKQGVSLIAVDVAEVQRRLCAGGETHGRRSNTPDKESAMDFTEEEMTILAAIRPVRSMGSVRHTDQFIERMATFLGGTTTAKRVKDVMASLNKKKLVFMQSGSYRLTADSMAAVQQRRPDWRSNQTWEVPAFVATTNGTHTNGTHANGTHTNGTKELSTVTPPAAKPEQPAQEVIQEVVEPVAARVPAPPIPEALVSGRGLLEVLSETQALQKKLQTIEKAWDEAKEMVESYEREVQEVQGRIVVLAGQVDVSQLEQIVGLFKRLQGAAR